MSGFDRNAADGFEAGAAAADRSMRRLLRGFMIALSLGVVGLVAWSATEIESAVIASGVFEVSSNAREVQHREGGRIGEILVKNGAAVAQGDVLIRLEDPELVASLGVLEARLIELTTERARLEAERDGADRVAAPEPPVTDAAGVVAFGSALANQRTLFAAERSARQTRIGQLEERARQLDSRMISIAAQLVEAKAERDSLEQELAVQQGLWEKRLTVLPRVNEVERRASQARARLAALSAAERETRSQQAEVALQIEQVGEEAASRALARLAEVEAEIARLAADHVAKNTLRDGLDIQAPGPGVVHELAVTTVGAVARPGQTLMSIIPTGEPMVLAARVSPRDIDRVRADQPARVRLTAPSLNAPIDLEGRVIRVSAATSDDERTGEPYFSARVEIAPEAAAGAPPALLTPGAPAQVFFGGRTRTVASYLLRPIDTLLGRTFKE